MVLYSYWRSSSAWRVRIALGWKNLSYEYRAVNLAPGTGQQHEDDFRRVNPFEQVPVLEFAWRGQTRRIAQSMAILTFIENEHPSPPLLPADPFLRARVWQLAEMVNAGIQPLQNLGTLRYVSETLGGDPGAFAQHFMTRGLVALEATAAETAGDFLVGDQVSLADVLLVPQLYNARRFGLEPERDHPLLARIDARCAALPAFFAAHPDRQPDGPPLLA
jgi:maleylpyruvate isomerase